MQETAGAVSELMKSLGNPKRLLLLCQLVEGEKSVSDLARLTASSPSRLSHAIAALEQRGWVSRRQCGEDKRRQFVTLTDDGAWHYGVIHDRRRAIAAARALVRMLGAPEPRVRLDG